MGISADSNGNSTAMSVPCPNDDHDIECGKSKEKVTALSMVERDIQRRIADFNQTKTPGLIMSSLSATGNLAFIQSDMRWVAECEIRRKNDMRPVSWKVFRFMEERSFILDPPFERIGMPVQVVREVQERKRLYIWRAHYFLICGLFSGLFDQQDFAGYVRQKRYGLLQIPLCVKFLDLHPEKEELVYWIGVALYATGVCSTTLVPDLDKHLWDLRLLFILMGMSQADTFVNWDVLSLTNREGVSRRCHQLQSFCTIVAVDWGLLALLLGFVIEDINQFAHLAGIFYGFCLTLPFVSKKNSSGVLGETSPASFRRLRVARIVCFAAAIGSNFIFLGLLWSSNFATSHLACPRCRCFNSYPFECRDESFEDDTLRYFI